MADDFSSASFLAEILVSSPQYCLDQRIQEKHNLNLKTEALELSYTVHASLCHNRLLQAIDFVFKLILN